MAGRLIAVGPLGVQPIENDPGARALMVEPWPGLRIEIPLDKSLCSTVAETLTMSDEDLTKRLEDEARDARAAAVARDAAQGAAILRPGSSN